MWELMICVMVCSRLSVNDCPQRMTLGITLYPGFGLDQKNYGKDIVATQFLVLTQVQTTDLIGSRTDLRYPQMHLLKVECLCADGIVR